MDFTFKMPVAVISGEDAAQRAGKEIAALGRRALIVTGGLSAKLNGALRDISSVLEKEGIPFAIFDGIGQNPLLSACHAAGAVAREAKADFIIGIGGGSPLDAAKAAAIYAVNPALAPEDIFSLSWQNPAMPLVLVGTTAGTGSELTSISVLTEDSTAQKRSINHPQCYAKIAVANPRYTDTMPRSVTISTALDALAHAVEGWFSPRRGDIAAVAGRMAIIWVWQGLLALKDDAPLERPLRDMLFYGSLWAGMVLSLAGTGFPHPLGYVLTEDFEIPHGRACTAFLPELVARGRETYPDRAEELFSSLIGCGYDEFCKIVRTLTDAELTMTSDRLEGYLKRWEGNRNFENSPGGYDTALAREMMHRRFTIQ